MTGVAVGLVLVSVCVVPGVVARLRGWGDTPDERAARS